MEVDRELLLTDKYNCISGRFMAFWNGRHRLEIERNLMVESSHSGPGDPVPISTRGTVHMPEEDVLNSVPLQ